MPTLIEFLESDTFAALFTWALELLGVGALAYVAAWVKKPIPVSITSVAATVWLGAVAMPLLFYPLPYLSWAVAVGTAALIIIALNAEAPNTDDRPGPMGP